MHRSTVLAATLAIAVASRAGVAQSVDEIPGSALAPYVPTTLGGLPRSGFNTYSAFVTASYRVSDAEAVTLQLHSVVGAGTQARMRSTCPTFTRIARFEACVRSSGVLYFVSWLFEDRLLVSLAAHDQATVLRLAGQLDLRGLATIAHAHR